MREHALDLERHGITSRTVHRHKKNHSHTVRVKLVMRGRIVVKECHTEVSTSTLTGTVLLVVVAVG